MPSATQQHILELQDIDVEILQLEHQFENHSLRSQLAESAEILVDAQSRLESAESALSGNEASQRQIQHRLAELETKQNLSQSKLYGGSVSAANELLALEGEVKGYQAKQDDHEETLLGLMEESDVLQATAADLQTKVDLAKSEVSETESSLQRALSKITTELDKRRAERSTQATKADSTLLSEYERLAPLYDGIPVARLANGGCDGCHIQLSVVALDQIARLPDSAIVSCEECGRLLVR